MKLICCVVMVVAFLWDFAVFCCLDGAGLRLVVLLCWCGDSGFTKLADGFAVLLWLIWFLVGWALWCAGAGWVALCWV